MLYLLTDENVFRLIMELSSLIQILFLFSLCLKPNNVEVQTEKQKQEKQEIKQGITIETRGSEYCNETTIYIPKKYHSRLLRIYKRADGYFGYIAEGYQYKGKHHIFSTTQKDFMEKVKNIGRENEKEISNEISTVKRKYQ